MRKQQQIPRFERESDLCAAFLSALSDVPPWQRHNRWTAYPETAGWDILLVRKRDGAQIGVEAKLRLNNKVVAQALPSMSAWAAGYAGPDFRAVLVPFNGCEGDLLPICNALGITTIRYSGSNGEWNKFSPSLPDFGELPRDDWHEWAPMQRHVVPDYIPDVVAGASAPVALTQWKIAAIKIAVLLESRTVGRRDFKLLGISPTRWTDPYTGWLIKTEAGYVRGPRFPDFAAQHPRNYAEIRSDREKWGAALSPLAASARSTDLLSGMAP